MDARAIGIFDSGVGGLSILREIQSQLPKEHFVFVADQKYVPYGAKTKEELEKRAEVIVRFLIDRDVKLVVVACNTATVYTIDYLRQRFSIPIIGVVPVIKTLVETTRTKKVGVMSTPATSKSPYLNKLIVQFAGAVQVYNIDGNGLEEMVENGEINSPAVTVALQTTLTPLLKNGIDCLALGCTHYPFLRKQIEAVVGPHVKVLDSGGAVARQVKRVLENNQQLALGHEKNSFYTTGEVSKFDNVATSLLKEEVKAQEINL